MPEGPSSNYAEKVVAIGLRSRMKWLSCCTMPSAIAGEVLRRTKVAKKFDWDDVANMMTHLGREPWSPGALFRATRLA